MRAVVLKSLILCGLLSVLIARSYALDVYCTKDDFESGDCGAGVCEDYQKCQKTAPALYKCIPNDDCQENCEPDNGRCMLAWKPGWELNDIYSCDVGYQCFSPVDKGECSPMDACGECATSLICSWRVDRYQCIPDKDCECTDTPPAGNCADNGGTCKSTCISPMEIQSDLYNCGCGSDKGKNCCVPADEKKVCHTLGGSCQSGFALGCPKGYVQISDGWCSTGYCCEWVGDGPSPEPKDPFINTIYKGPAIDDLSKLLGPVAKVLYYGGLAIGIFFIILSGYNLMTSGGNPQKTQSAQEQLTAAIIGIMFILLSSTILRIIIDDIIGL